MNISAVLLAGGESRRMRKDKATLLFQGQPFWQIQLNLLRRLDPQEIFLSAQADPAWRPFDVQFVPDDPPSRGPISGLSASLARIRGSHLIALAIDMPFMDQRFLRSLCDKIEPGVGVVPMIEKRAEPLAAIYPAEAHADLLAALPGPDFSLQSATRKLVRVGKLKVVHVAKAEEAFFLNLNEPADVAESLVSSQRMQE
jgi:molybdopterin-guanine dinucleotide biosynthesis protein A